jgi:hypothetical protein
MVWQVVQLWYLETPKPRHVRNYVFLSQKSWCLWNKKWEWRSRKVIWVIVQGATDTAWEGRSWWSQWGSNGSLSMLLMMKVMVWHSVSTSHSLWLHSLSCYLQGVFVEISLQSHRSVLMKLRVPCLTIQLCIADNCSNEDMFETAPTSMAWSGVQRCLHAVLGSSQVSQILLRPCDGGLECCLCGTTGFIQLWFLSLIPFLFCFKGYIELSEYEHCNLLVPQGANTGTINFSIRNVAQAMAGPKTLQGKRLHDFLCLKGSWNTFCSLTGRRLHCHKSHVQL